MRSARAITASHLGELPAGERVPALRRGRAGTEPMQEGPGLGHREAGLLGEADDRQDPEDVSCRRAAGR